MEIFACNKFYLNITRNSRLQMIEVSKFVTQVVQKNRKFMILKILFYEKQKIAYVYYELDLNSFCESIYFEI